MPYKRKYMRKRNYKRKGPSVRSLQRQVNKLRKVTKPETKWVNQDLNLAPAYDGVTDINLYPLSQGTTQHTRVGHQTLAKSWYGRLLLRWNTGDVNTLYRIVFYIPRNSVDRLSDHGGLGVPLSTIADIDGDRFTVLSDRSVTIGAPNSGNESYKQLVFKKKFKTPITQVFDGASANVIEKNMIRMYITSTAASSQARPSFEGYMKCYFMDP